MKKNTAISLSDVQAVYSGPEGELWELVMGEQIHVGGLKSSMDLAEKAGIAEGSEGVDLCCCAGAGMKFLVRFRKVGGMRGVDATGKTIETGTARTKDEGLEDRVQYTLAEATDTGLADASADFVWGEDAWCYVEDKERLIAEAARLVKPGGTIAFTDWVEGADEATSEGLLTDEEAQRFLAFMKFPNIQTISGYKDLLERNDCEVLHAHDTGRFAPHVDLYLEMLDKQLTYDALKIIGFDLALMEAMGKEMAFMQGLAHEGKIAQGLFVARKR